MGTMGTFLSRYLLTQVCTFTDGKMHSAFTPAQILVDGGEVRGGGVESRQGYIRSQHDFNNRVSYYDSSHTRIQILRLGHKPSTRPDD